MGVLRLAGRRQVRLFARKDQYGRFISCLVYLPRDRFTTANRLRMQEILLQRAERDRRRLHHPGQRHPAGPHPLHRAHRPDAPGRRDRRQRALGQAGRGDPAVGGRLHAAAGAQVRRGPRARAARPVRRRAARDVQGLAHRASRRPRTWPSWSCSTSRASSCCTCSGGARTTTDVRFKVFRYGEPMMLSDVLPVLHSLGVRVEDERPYEIRRADGVGLHLRLRPLAAGRMPGR